MKIIEALKELPLIKKKIDSNNALLSKYSSYMKGGDLYLETEEAHKKEVEQLTQSNKDLFGRYISLSCAIHKTNAQTKVKILDEERTIEEWIIIRDGAHGLKSSAIQALNDHTASLQSQKISRENWEDGVKLVRFYDVKKRDTELSQWTETVERIDAKLEVVNAETDIVE
jgi:Rad3-related DNA helicase